MKKTLKVNNADVEKKKLYEQFHHKSLVQFKIVGRNNFTYRNLLGVLENILKSRPEIKNILDIGCGAGTVCLYLANKGYKVLGIDISKNAISTCQQSAKALKLKNISFRKINFPSETLSGKFDLIICSEVLEHIKDDSLALKKIFTLLNHQGVVIFSVPSKNAPLHRLGLARKFDIRVGHLRRYSPMELEYKIRNSGLIILKAERTEGILRNFLFLNSYFGKSIRFIKFFLSDVVTFFDEITLRLFGESNIFVIAQKM